MFPGVLLPMGSATTGGLSYRDHPYWLRYQEFFPGGLRVTDDNAPIEQWWSWGGGELHLDRFPMAEAPATVVALHGIGGYGRMLSPFGRLPAMAGMDFVAPDLPGCGLSRTPSRHVRYESWVRCVVDLIRDRLDARPVVLLGVGLGGRLAYDVASVAGDAVAGVVATCLADPCRPEVRRRLISRPSFGRPLRWLGAGPLRRITIPLRWFANIAAMSNSTRFAKLVWSDPFGGAARIPLGFVRSLLHRAPSVEPEHFHGAPVLLAHPELDHWSPPPLSRGFLDRLGTVTRFTLLSGTGHLPVEEPGFSELDRAVRDFLNEINLR